jgi:hypothetical protein
MKVIAAYRVKRTNKVVRVIRGASCTTQVLTFEDKRDIPQLPIISTEKAKEITGNYTLFN